MGGGKGRREDLGEGRRSKCDEEKVEGRQEGWERRRKSPRTDGGTSK